MAKIYKTNSKLKIYREGEDDWTESEKGYEQHIEDEGAEVNFSYHERNNYCIRPLHPTL